MDTKKLIAERISQEIFPLSDKGIEKLASTLIRTDLKKGEFFLREGEVCRQIGFVYKGMIRQFYYKNNKDLTEYFAYENKFFVSIESFFRQAPSHMIIEGVEPTIIYGMAYEELMKYVDENKEIATLYHKMLEYSLIISQRQTDSLRFETAKERYCRLLKDDPEIVRRAQLAHIASYLLMTPETLSRVRANVL